MISISRVLSARPVVTVIASGAVLSVVVALVVFGLLPVAPIALFFPALYGVPQFVLIPAAAITFWAWSHPLFAGVGGVPGRSQLALMAWIIISIVWFAVGWGLGLRYQGMAFLLSMAAINTVVAIGLWCLGWWADKTQSFTGGLAFHFGMALWLVTVGLPYLGESP